MDYGYKITTHGRQLLAALLNTGQPLRLTRSAVGSGLIDQDEDLAKVHALVQYAVEATITDRRHEEDRLFLTVQYSNQDHPDVGTFTLSEFMVWAEDPETGQETDFLYATLGDFRQPVPGYSDRFPAGTWSYPVVMAISGELEVNITASPGLVTSLDLQEAIDRLETEFEQKLEELKKKLIYRVANDIWKHNTDGGSHLNFLIADAVFSPPIMSLPVPEDAQDILDDYIDVSNWWKTTGT